MSAREKFWAVIITIGIFTGFLGAAFLIKNIEATAETFKAIFR